MNGPLADLVSCTCGLDRSKCLVHPSKVVPMSNKVELGMPITGMELYRMPEWTALCKAIGIDIKPTTGLIIHVKAPDEVVEVFESYHANVRMTAGYKLLQDEKAPGSEQPPTPPAY